MMIHHSDLFMLILSLSAAGPFLKLRRKNLLLEAFEINNR